MKIHPYFPLFFCFLRCQLLPPPHTSAPVGALCCAPRAARCPETPPTPLCATGPWAARLLSVLVPPAALVVTLLAPKPRKIHHTGRWATTQTDAYKEMMSKLRAGVQPPSPSSCRAHAWQSTEISHSEGGWDTPGKAQKLERRLGTSRLEAGDRWPHGRAGRRGARSTVCTAGLIGRWFTAAFGAHGGCGYGFILM